MAANLGNLRASDRALARSSRGAIARRALPLGSDNGIQTTGFGARTESDMPLDRRQFIQEAKHNLHTIEQGLLNLSEIVTDTSALERLLQEARQLATRARNHNCESIASIATALAETFQTCQSAALDADERLNDLLWRVCDTLKGLIEMQELALEDKESSYLSLGVEQEVVSATQPVLEQLQRHVRQLLYRSGATYPGDDGASRSPDFHQQVLLQLQEMVQILKQPSKGEGEVRSQLLARVEQIGELDPGELPRWQDLLQAVEAAIANPNQDLRSAARIAIRELGQARELILANRAREICIVPQLHDLATSSPATQLPDAWITGGWSTQDFSSPSANNGKAPPSSSYSQLEDFWQDEDSFLGAEPRQEGTSLNQQSDFAELLEEVVDEYQTLSDEETEQLSRWFDDPISSDRDPDSGFEETLWEAAADGVDPSQERNGSRFEDTPTKSAWDEIFDWEVAQTPTPGEDPPPRDAGGDLDWLATWDSTFEEESLTRRGDRNGYLDEIEDLEALFSEEGENTFLQQARGSSSGSVAATTIPSRPEFYPPFEELQVLLESSMVKSLSSSQATELAREIEQQPSDREAYLKENPPSNPAMAAEELGDLDKLLEQTSTIAVSSAPSSIQVPSKRSPNFEPNLKVPARHMDGLSNLLGELVVNRNGLDQDRERLRSFLDNLLEQVQILNDIGGRMQDLYERSLLESSLLASKQSQSPKLDSSGDRDSEYDPLEMDRFTNFHSLSQEMIEAIVRVRESSADIEFVTDGIELNTRTLRQVTTQLQEGLTKARMVPFAQLSDRLPRAVRDISIKLGKNAHLEVIGNDTLVDKAILEQLSAPMTHLVNNAMTHGIEAPEVRRERGKPARGTITIRALHQGNQTLISIADDGAGIDPEVVRRKAIQKGLVGEAEASQLSEAQVLDFIFHPGFSTKEKADDFAGRGVGMDVVRTTLLHLRGSISIDSVLGEGTTFIIGLPLTLSICKALCCLNEKSLIAFPMDGVEGMFDIRSDEIVIHENGERYIPWKRSREEDPSDGTQQKNSLLPFKPLSELLSYNRQLSRGTVYGGKQDDDETLAVVVLRGADDEIAVQVDGVLEELEIAIKQLSAPVPKPPGIAGATVLGDGTVMAIADVLELIDLFYGRLRLNLATPLGDGRSLESGAAIESEPMVLIVDDSITVRELLSLSFSKAGYRVEQARDGQEAWEKLRSGLPCDLVFCDIEMPRMDGLELLSRLQNDADLQQIPVGMLTSRGADRHRQMAAKLGAKGYFTKPYLEEVLLEAAERMIAGDVLLEIK